MFYQAIIGKFFEKMLFSQLLIKGGLLTPVTDLPAACINAR